MKLSIVVALANNNVIGKDGKLPWNIPEDKKRFKKITEGHCVLMGRETHDSIGGPLPARTNLILTRDKTLQKEGCVVLHTLRDAVKYAIQNGEQELMVIGGEQIYRLTLPLVEKIYMTKILQDFEGDTFFPQIDETSWKEISREEFHDEKIPFEFRTLERRG